MLLKVKFMEMVMTILNFYFSRDAGSGRPLALSHIDNVRKLYENIIGKTKELGWSSEAHHRMIATESGVIDDDGRLLPTEEEVKDPKHISSNYWVYLILSVYVARIISLGFDKESEREMMRGHVVGLMEGSLDPSLLPSTPANRMNCFNLIEWSVRNYKENDGEGDRNHLNSFMIRRVGKRMLRCLRSALQNL